MEKKLFLLDAYALIYRAYYALIRAPRITSYGFNTSAIFGFCNTLEEVLRKEKPSHIAVCFDPYGPTFRHEAYQEYKANREKQPEDITLSIPYIKDIIVARGIPVIEIEGYEADDVIGTLSRKAENEGFITYMMTPDKDYGQLVTDKVLIYKPSLRGQDFEIRDVERIKEKYGIETPHQLIDILALEGDKIDNIPGCPGIGEITAQKLIKEFGSVENLIESTDKLKGATKDKIVNNSEQIIFSKFLATIKTDVPIDIDLDSLEKGEENLEQLKSIYEKLEFRSLLNRLPKTDKAANDKINKAVTPQPSMAGTLFDLPQIDEDAEEKIHTVHDLPIKVHKKTDYNLEWFKTITENLSHVGLSIKSIGENAFYAKVFAIAVAISEDESLYYEMPGSLDLEGLEKMKALMECLFGRKNLCIITTDLKRLTVLLNNLKIITRCKFFDVSLASYLIDPEARHLLPEIAHSILRYATLDYFTEPSRRKPYELTDRESLPHAMSEAACLTMRLKEPLQASMDKDGLTSLYENVELPLAIVLAQMEIAGVRVDVLELKNLSKQYTSRLYELEAKVYELAGERFNVGSPSQVGTILFDKLQIDAKAKKTKKGTYSTTEEILEKYRNEYPIVDYILKIRQLKKLLATYIDALPTLVDPNTGKIHTTFNQTVTSTGRLSSTNPNLQNIPVRGDDGREIRRAFIADEGCIFMSADYSQIELRLMADFSKDPHMLNAFAENLDIHQDTAARIYHKKLEDVTSGERRNAKTANFGIIYGISPFGLSERLGISKSEAKKLIDDYKASYPSINDYIQHIIGTAKEQGYVTTFTGRRRYLPEINSQNAVVRGYGERNAVNAPLQGSAADIIKIAMIAIQKRLKAQGFKSEMIMQVHDELLFNVYPDELVAIQQLVTEEMEKSYDGDVRLTTSIGTGRNWLEAH